jgi:hypothetical protein
MRLPDVEGKMFGLIVHWIYRQEIEGGHNIGLLPAAKLWTLADRFMIPELQNSVIPIIRELIVAEKQSLWDLLLFAYKSKLNTPLKMMVADRLSLLSPQLLRNYFDGVQDELGLEVVAGLAMEVAVAFSTGERNPKTSADERLRRMVPVQKYYVDVPKQKEG